MAAARPPTAESERANRLSPGDDAKLEAIKRLPGGASMSIIWAIIIGFVVGLVAKLLMPGRDPGGFIITTILGIVGALVATYLGQAMGWYAAGQSAGFIGSVVV